MSKKTPETKAPLAKKAAPAKPTNRASERRQERQQEQRRQRFLIGGGVMLAIALSVLLAVVASRAPVEAPIPTDLTARYDGLPVSRTERGYLRLGNPDGTVRVSAFISLSESDSRTFHRTVFPALLERVRSGEITFSYVLYDASQRMEASNSAGATRAAWCANEQNRLFAYVDAAYGWFDQYGVQGAYASNRLRSGAENLGLDMGLFDDCLRSNRPQEQITRAQQDAGGRDSTVVAPTVFVNDVPVAGEDLLLAANDAINRALELRSGGQPTAEPTSDATVSPDDVTAEPTAEPTTEPTAEPTAEPTTEPTAEPTVEPTVAPTATADS